VYPDEWRNTNHDATHVVDRSEAFDHMIHVDRASEYGHWTEKDQWPALTATERAIVEQLATGQCSKEMAVTLQRSRATIEFHIRALFFKLNARSRAQIVAHAFYAGILPIDR